MSSLSYPPQSSSSSTAAANRSLNFSSAADYSNKTSSNNNNDPGNKYIRTAWVRRSGTDAFSSLPVHIKEEYSSVADILLVAHRLLYTPRDSVTPADVELVIDQSQSVAMSMDTTNHIPISNLDTLEVLAAYRRRELHLERERIQQQQEETESGGASQSKSGTNKQNNYNSLNPLFQQKTESEKLAARLTDQQNTPNGNNKKSSYLSQQQQQSNHHYQPDDPVDIFLILRRRHRAGGGYATSSLVDAVLMDDPKVVHDRNVNRTRAQQQQQQQSSRAKTPTRTTTPNQNRTSNLMRTPTTTLQSPRAGTPSASASSNRASRLRKDFASSSAQKNDSNNNKTPTTNKQENSNNQQQQQQIPPELLNTPQGRALADAQRASPALMMMNNFDSNNNNILSPTVSSAIRQHPTVQQVITSPTHRRASPSRQEAEDAVLQCKEFAPKWLKEAFCDHCNRPKRMHTHDAIKHWEEKAKRHASPSLSKRDLSHLSSINRNARHEKPLWKPKKVTDKANADVNPLSCAEFIPCWGREAFCSKCHGQKDGHTRAALEVFVEKHKEAGYKDREWNSQRPFPKTSFEERREHRTVATAKRCEAFVPLWNHNDFCAICFQPEVAHPMEKRYFNFPNLTMGASSSLLDGSSYHQHHHHQRPSYLTNQHFASSALARNFWISAFPWKYVVVYLPLEDLFSLASAERWLLVELRPLMKSTLTLIAQNGVNAHYDLRNDAVRVASHLESASGEVKGLLAKIMDGLFVVEKKSGGTDGTSSPDVIDEKGNNNHNNSASVATNDESGANTSKGNDSISVSTEGIILSGSVGSRSALLRKLSRIFLADKIMTKRQEILRDIDLLETTLMTSGFTGEQIINTNTSSTTNDDALAPNPQHFETPQSHAVVSELLKILKRTEFQHDSCKRARRYLSQELIPL